MLPTPTRFKAVAASAEGGTKLNAFDNALLRAGVGNLNLLRVSSVLPARCHEAEHLDLAPASLLPIAYGSIVSDLPGELIAAGVVVGIQDEEHAGAIFEFSGRCSRLEAEQVLQRMIEEAFQVRNMKLNRIIIKAAEHRVERVGCAFAGVPLWY